MEGSQHLELEAILSQFEPMREFLIPIVQRVQDTYGYVPPNQVEPIARYLGLLPAEVQGVVTFYAQFSLVLKGKHVVRVCRVTACHVRGGKSILKVAQEYLGIREGQTRDDLNFSLEIVACLGTCFLAPVLMVDRNYYGRLVPPK